MPVNNENREAPLLDWPREWGRPRLPTVLIVALVFVVVMALIFIPYTLDYARRGEPLRATFGAAAGLMCVSFFAVFIPRLKVRKSSLPRTLMVRPVNDEGIGLRVDVHSSMRPLLAVWLLIGAAFLALRGILLMSNMTGSSSTRAGIDLGGLIIVVVALAMIAFLVFYLFVGRGQQYFFAMTEQGVSQGLGRTTRALAWHEIGLIRPIMLNNTHTVQIIPTPGNRVHIDTGRSLIDRLQRGLLEKSIDLPTSALSIDPSLLLHAVHFYWQHPEARHELATEAVIDRMQRGELMS
ncbi:hypothetical protein GZH49_33285 [Nocardia terpenica]|uniref:hypothetical protein n=1 Tax=Nocardia terpenica TaxID=455432 RepID=UPI002FE20C7A